MSRTTRDAATGDAVMDQTVSLMNVEPAMSSAAPSGPTFVNVRECLRMGWNRTATHFLQFAAVLLSMAVASVAFEFLGSVVNAGLLRLAFQLLGIVVPWVLGFGLFRLALSIADDVPVSQGTAWNVDGLDHYLLASLILVVPVVFLSTITFGVALILGGPMLLMYPYFVVDRSSGGKKSIRQSWTAGAIHYADMFRLNLAVIGLVLLGLITVVGWLITIPMALIAVARAYRTATGPPGPWD